MPLKNIYKYNTKVYTKVGSVERFESKKDLTVLLVLINKIASNCYKRLYKR